MPLLLKRVRFDDNNNINHKNIASTLGDVGIHFIGIKALKVHFFKKLVNLTSYTLKFWIEYHSYSFYFSGLRENQKQDKVDLGNDGEDDMTEDLNTLSALYDKIKSNINSLNQWVPFLGTSIFYTFLSFHI